MSLTDRDIRVKVGPNSLFDGEMTDEQEKEIMRLANIIYFQKKVWDRTYWMGLNIAKCPMDLITYQEIIVNVRPDLIIETGTLRGGSALYFAQICDLVGKGRVMTIDIESRPSLPQHPRIEYVVAPSTHPKLKEFLDKKLEGAGSVLVILDSDHRRDHVLKELRMYAGYVSVGSYIIVEDSCFDGFPAWPEYGPGATAAIDAFLAEDDHFEVDYSMEKHMLTFSPKGFLKKIKD